MNAAEITRALIFNRAIPATKLAPEVCHEVQELLSTFGLHLNRVGENYVTYSYSPILQQIMPTRWIKFLNTMLDTSERRVPICSEDSLDPTFLKLLLYLQYVELQNLPSHSDALPPNATKGVKTGEKHVVFTSRLFEETGQGTVCAACYRLGGFMLACGCGKYFHVECCRSMQKCCAQSAWDDVLESWNFPKPVDYAVDAGAGFSDKIFTTSPVAHPPVDDDI